MTGPSLPGNVQHSTLQFHSSSSDGIRVVFSFFFFAFLSVFFCLLSNGVGTSDYRAGGGVRFPPLLRRVSLSAAILQR